MALTWDIFVLLFHKIWGRRLLIVDQLFSICQLHFFLNRIPWGEFSFYFLRFDFISALLELMFQCHVIHCWLKKKSSGSQLCLPRDDLKHGRHENWRQIVRRKAEPFVTESFHHCRSSAIEMEEPMALAFVRDRRT